MLEQIKGMKIKHWLLRMNVNLQQWLFFWSPNLVPNLEFPLFIWISAGTTENTYYHIWVDILKFQSYHIN